MHPNQFQALFNRHLLSLVPIAQLTSIYVNARQPEDSEQTTALDFMPGIGPQEMTPEVRAIFDQLAFDQMKDHLLALKKPQ